MKVFVVTDRSYVQKFVKYIYLWYKKFKNCLDIYFS